MKKIFIGFAIEDKFARDNLVYHEKKEHNYSFAIAKLCK